MAFTGIKNDVLRITAVIGVVFLAAVAILGSASAGLLAFVRVYNAISSQGVLIFFVRLSLSLFGGILIALTGGAMTFAFISLGWAVVVGDEK